MIAAHNRLDQNIVTGVIGELEVNLRVEDGGIHARSTVGPLVVADGKRVVLAFVDRQSGQQRGPEGRGTNLTQPAAILEFFVIALNYQLGHVSGRSIDFTQLGAKVEDFTGRDKQIVVSGRTGPDVLETA